MREHRIKHKVSVPIIGENASSRRYAIGDNGDLSTRVWDAELGQEICTLIGHTDIVCSQAVTNDGKRILTGSRDNTARLWDTDTGEQLKVFRHQSDLCCIALSPKGNYVVTSDTVTYIWNADNVLVVNDICMHVARIDENETFLVVAGDTDIVHVIDIRTGITQRTLNHGNIAQIFISVDRIFTATRDGFLRVWNGTQHTEFQEPCSWKQAFIFAVSADGRFLIKSKHDGFDVFDVYSGEIVHQESATTSSLVVCNNSVQTIINKKVLRFMPDFPLPNIIGYNRITAGFISESKEFLIVAGNMYESWKIVETIKAFLGENSFWSTILGVPG